MSNNSISVHTLDEGYETTVTTRKKSKLPRFRAIGMKKMDAIHILTTMSANEAITFNALIKVMDYTNNLSKFSTSILTPTDKVRFSKGLTSLRKRGLAQRLYKGKVSSTYRINPDLILPKDYASTLTEWEAFVNKAS